MTDGMTSQNTDLFSWDTLYRSNHSSGDCDTVSRQPINFHVFTCNCVLGYTKRRVNSWDYPFMKWYNYQLHNETGVLLPLIVYWHTRPCEGHTRQTRLSSLGPFSTSNPITDAPELCSDWIQISLKTRNATESKNNYQQSMLVAETFEIHRIGAESI
jgi:hypothetical protein